MNAATHCAMQEPVGPQEVDTLQAVFDAVLYERRLNKQSMEALDLARSVLRFYFEGVHEQDALLALLRVE